MTMVRNKIIFISLVMLFFVSLIGCTEQQNYYSNVEGTLKSVEKLDSSWLRVCLEDEYNITNIEFDNVQSDYWVSELNSLKGEKIRIEFEVIGEGWAGPVRRIITIKVIE